MQKDKKYMAVAIKPSSYKKLKELAGINYRSLINQLEYMIDKYIEKGEQ